MTSPAEILRSRCRAVGVEMTNEQAEGTVAAMRAHGFKITARDIGESREVALDFGPTKPDGSRDVTICSNEPQVVWARIWDEMA